MFKPDHEHFIAQVLILAWKFRGPQLVRTIYTAFKMHLFNTLNSHVVSHLYSHGPCKITSERNILPLESYFK